MEKEALIKHKTDLIDIYTKTLHMLEIRQAEQSTDIDLFVINQTENIKKIIKQIESDLVHLRSDETLLNSLRLVSYPLQKYENFITKFSEELNTWNNDASRFLKVVLNGLRKATDSKCVFIARYLDNDWQVIGDDNLDEKEIKGKYIQNGSFSYVLGQQRGLYISRSGVANFTSLIYPFANSSKEILVFHDLEDSGYDKAFELILETMVQLTNSFQSPKEPALLEMYIYNNLRRSYGYVSDAMYNRQYYLFNQELVKHTVQFEPIIYLNPHAPSIYGWEALARDEKLERAPVELFETAELWGVRFQLQLDMYFLTKAIEIYTGSNNGSIHVRRKHEMLPLSVNVNPASLLRSRYRETIQKISKQEKMPLNQLFLEISERAPLPTPENWDGIGNITEAFRDELDFYEDFEIHFSVDDFGVGYASSSRVSRLRPAIVKIDRDALMDNSGDFTLKFIISSVKKMGGAAKVVVEGFDDKSQFSLKRLFDMGVRYVQGHKYGNTRSEIDNRLPLEIYKLIQNELK